jgi:hypothetical protein
LVALVDAILSDTLLEEITTPFPNHLIVYTGSSPESTAQHFKRQTPTLPSLQASSSTKPLKSGILHHYQILTPGLIVSLGLVIFLLLPILTISLRALASIQSPSIGAGAAKSFSASEKKNQ